jgi:hypothetical protein
MSKTNIIEEIEKQKLICLNNQTITNDVILKVLETNDVILKLLEIIHEQQQRINDLEIKIFEIEDKTRIKW